MIQHSTSLFTSTPFLQPFLFVFLKILKTFPSRQWDQAGDSSCRFEQRQLPGHIIDRPRKNNGTLCVWIYIYSRNRNQIALSESLKCESHFVPLCSVQGELLTYSYVFAMLWSKRECISKVLSVLFIRSILFSCLILVLLLWMHFFFLSIF